MKKPIFIVIALVVVLLAVGYFFLQNRSPEPITLYIEEGKVMVKSGDNDYVEAIDAQVIDSGSYVKTAEDGLAHIVLPDNSMTSLSFNTEMQINYDGGSTNIIQTLGNAWYRVQKLAGKNEFKVETPQAVAAVRGTIFGADVGGSEQIYITEGSLLASRLVDGETQGETTLEQGKIVSVEGDALSAPADIPEEKRETPWFRRNEILNKEFRDTGKVRDFVKNLKTRSDLKDTYQEMIESRVSGAQTSNSPIPQFGDNWLGNYKEACDYINSADYDQAIAGVEASRANLGNWGDWYIKMIKLAKDACRDGVIDAGEIAKFEEIRTSMPDFNLPQ